MSQLADFIDGLVDESKKLAKDQLKELIASAKEDESDFIRLQAENIERWTVMLAQGDLTPKGYKKLVQKMEILAQLEVIKLKAQTKARAQLVADGIREQVVNGLFLLV